MIPRPVGHRRTVRILPIRHKPQTVGRPEQEGRRITDRPHRRPPTPDVILPRAVATGEARDRDAFDRPRVHIGNRTPHDRRHQVTTVIGLIFGDGRERGTRRRQHRRIVHRRHRDTGRIRRGREGHRPPVRTRIHLRPFRPAGLIPRPVRHRRTVRILPVRDKPDAVRAAQEQGRQITDRPHRRPAAPDVVLPRPVATRQAGNGDAFDRPRVHIGNRTPHDRRHQMAAIARVILRDGRERGTRRCQHRRIVFRNRSRVKRKFRG